MRKVFYRNRERSPNLPGGVYYKLIEEAARRDNMTVEEWAEATLIKDAQKRMKNYYDDSSLPEDVSLAAEVPEEYGAPRRSGPSSSPPSSARRKPRQ